jgi:TniQ
VNHWRRLPIPLPPAQHETLASYLGRLARVHGLPCAQLWQHLGGMSETGAGRAITSARLSAVTGHPPDSLTWALPELREPTPHWPALRHLAQHTCPRCTSRHHNGPVRRLFAHHHYLCLRHGYWIGPPDPVHGSTPPHLATLFPELGTAQRRHKSIADRRGWLVAFDAVVASTGICLDLRLSAADHDLWWRWEHRLDQLIPAGTRDAYRRSLFLAGIYPEMIGLAELLAAPHSQALATHGQQDDLRHLLTAAGQALGSHARLVDGAAHPIVAWARTRAARPPARPAAIYPNTRHHDDGAPHVSDEQRFDERKTTRHFATDRRAPRTYRTPLPYAHRPSAGAGPVVAASRRSV